MTEHNQGPKLRVAIVGAGTMGGAFATRLLGAGMDVNVWSRDARSTRHLIDLGATGYAEVTDAVQNAEVVVTMLPTAEVTTRLMFDGHGFDAMAEGAHWVQMATIGVKATDSINATVGARRGDVVFIDAPVSGSRGPAESGQLLILASGPDSSRASLEPVFSVLGRRTAWLGPVGAGSRMKLILNTWLAFQIEGAAESAGLARRLGVDPASLTDALSDSPLASQYALAKLDRMLGEDYSPDFAIDLALKDLDLATSDGGTDTAPIAGAIAERWRRLVTSGSSGLDVSAAAQGLGSRDPYDS